MRRKVCFLFETPSGVGIVLTTNLPGGGKGSWSAWKAGEMARRYEAAGGDYKDTGDNKNKAKKGEPEKK